MWLTTSEMGYAMAVQFSHGFPTFPSGHTLLQRVWPVLYLTVPHQVRQKDYDNYDIYLRI